MEHKGPASPAPAGLVAFAVACWTFAAVFLGLVPYEGLPALAAWLFGGFVVQIIVAKGELEEGNLVGGNVFCFFQGFFMLTSALSTLFKWLAPILTSTPVDTKVEGFGWLVCAIALILWTPAYYKTSNGNFSIAVTVTDIALVLIALKDLALITAPSVNLVIGILLFIPGALGIYVASAGILNATYGKPVLPLMKPFVKSKEE